MNSAKILNFLAGLLVVLISTAIVILPFLVSSKFLTFDAGFYLHYADLFKKGELFQKFFFKELELLGIWPFGFPMFLGMISWITQTDTFLGARILQLLFFLSFVILLVAKFKSNWQFYLSFLATGMFLSIFLYPLTEAGFIVFGFYFLALLDLKRTLVVKLLLVLLPLLIFSFRYIGVFILIFIFLYLMFIQWDRVLLLSGILLLLFSTLYFIFIYYQTGLFSGIERKGGIVSRTDLMIQYLTVSIAQFSYFDFTNFGGKIGRILFFVGLFPFVIIGFNLLKRLSEFRLDTSLSSFTKNCLLYGLSYLVIYFFLTIILGWDHDGEGITSRFIYPGMVFISCGLFHELVSRSHISISDRFILLSSALISTGYYLLSGLYF